MRTRGSSLSRQSKLRKLSCRQLSMPSTMLPTLIAREAGSRSATTCTFHPAVQILNTDLWHIAHWHFLEPYHRLILVSRGCELFSPPHMALAITGLFSDRVNHSRWSSFGSTRIQSQ